jgi:hypothetical protein
MYHSDGVDGRRVPHVSIWNVKTWVQIACVAAGIAGLCSLPGCRRSPSSTVFLDPALSVLIPADTKLIAGVRLQRLLASDARQTVAAAPRLLEFRQDMGLPRDADVWEFLISYNGTSWLAFMRGQFTEMGMEPRLEKPGASRLMHDGVTVLGDAAGAVAFLNPTTAIGGRIEDVVRALDGRNENAGIPESLQKLAAEIPSKYDVWFVSRGVAPPFVRVQGVRSARGGVNLSTRRYDLLVEADSGSVNHIDSRVPDEVLDWVLGRLP